MKQTAARLIFEDIGPALGDPGSRGFLGPMVRPMPLPATERLAREYAGRVLHPVKVNVDGRARMSRRPTKYRAFPPSVGGASPGCDSQYTLRGDVRTSIKKLAVGAGLSPAEGTGPD